MLSYFFTMFKSGHSVSLASRVLDFYGRVFLRTRLIDVIPTVHPRVNDRYYFAKKDRDIGKEMRANAEGYADSVMAATQMRELERPLVARGVFFLSLLFCTACVIVAGSVSTLL